MSQLLFSSSFLYSLTLEKGPLGHRIPGSGGNALPTCWTYDQTTSHADVSAAYPPTNPRANAASSPESCPHQSADTVLLNAHFSRGFQRRHRLSEPAVVVRIHPGQFMLPQIHSRLRAHGTILVLGFLFVPPLSLWGQQSPPDSAELQKRARRAQRDFESTHRTLLPRGADRTGDRCDEYVGRLCLSSTDLSWEPAEEDFLVVSGREHLLGVLEEVGREVPGDRWVLG